MQTKVSRLYRIYRIIYERWEFKSDSNKSYIDSWGDYFSLQNGDNEQRRYDTIMLLNSLRNEVVLAERMMKDTDLSPQLYSDAFNAIKRLLSIETINHGSAGYRSVVSNDVLLALKWCAETQPTDESQIDENELASLQKELSELKNSVELKELPPVAKEFVLRQIGIIERAIIEYKIIGIKAFENAQDQALIDLVRNQSVAKSYQTTKPLQKLSNCWQHVQRFITEFGKIVRMLKDTKDIYEFSKGFLGDQQ